LERETETETETERERERERGAGKALSKVLEWRVSGLRFWGLGLRFRL
jgi:hypothetical protein